MKTPYKKPLLGVETFSLLQTAARDCADNIPNDALNLGDIATCVWNLGDGTTVFIAGSTCMIDGDEFACYNNPGEGMYIFHS